MGRLGFVKVLDCFSLSISSSSCLCINYSLDAEDEYGVGRDCLIKSYQGEQILKLRDILEPKTVILRVSMHCNGCAKKVEKHIKKMEGVTSCTVDLDTKKVVVTGDITPFEVLERVSKVKFAELWMGPYHESC